MIPELRIATVRQDTQPVADADRILGHSLAEIKRGAVRRVLWEEKGNKTKAAKRAWRGSIYHRTVDVELVLE